MKAQRGIRASLVLGLFGVSTLSVFSQTTGQPRMGEPASGLTASELDRFEKGKQEFDRVLLLGEGLGPIFNDSSCGQCHSGPAVGGSSVVAVTRFGKAASGMTPFDPLAHLGGPLLQRSVAGGLDPSCEEFVPPEADVVIMRMTPHAFGAGLLEAVDDADILVNEAFPPHPAVSGVARWVQPVEGGPMKIGRFGWKGGVATMLTFSADASVNELGLTNRFFTMDQAPNGDASLLGPPINCDTVADPEDGPDAEGFDRIDRQADFQRFLASPPQTPRNGMLGEKIFDRIGCSACHVPSFTTGVAAESALSNKTIRPYGDFLLHDMGDSAPLGDGCGDGIVDGIATERVMQTRALWGLGMRTAFIHDGRATGGTWSQDIDAAIQVHGGEASFARTGYNALSAADKQALYDFLLSLGRPEFDYDPAFSSPGSRNDNKIDEFDWFFLLLDGWFTGPGGSIGANDPGAVGDVDQDGSFDMADWAHLQRSFTGS